MVAQSAVKQRHRDDEKLFPALKKCFRGLKQIVSLIICSASALILRESALVLSGLKLIQIVSLIICSGSALILSGSVFILSGLKLIQVVSLIICSESSLILQFFAQICTLRPIKCGQQGLESGKTANIAGGSQFKQVPPKQNARLCAAHFVANPRRMPCLPVIPHPSTLFRFALTRFGGLPSRARR